MRSKRRRFFLVIVVMFFSILAGGVLGAVTAYLKSAPSLDMVTIRQDFTTYIYDINGELITDLFRLNRVPISIHELPAHVPLAVVAIEDDQFYAHHGINFLAFARAIWVNLQQMRFAQGGGTITMQLARNVFLTQEKTVVRKLEEFLWAVQIERKYAKDEILEAYMNEVYLNHGAYGLEAGAQTYFGKSAKDLSLSEAATLAGVIRWPNRYSPFVNYDIAKDRRDFVLSRMEYLGFISAPQARQAKAEPIVLVERTRRIVNAPYFVDYVLQQLLETYGDERVFGGGLRVYTTLDLRVQEAAEKAFESGLPPVRKVGGEVYLDNQGKIQPQGALLAMDPRNGHIRAMIGGREEIHRWNRAAETNRSPGSAIKIFPYAAAIDHGITPGTVYIDEPVSFRLITGETYSPQNYAGTFLGPLTVREALERSTNTVATKIVNELGFATVLDYGKKMGITTFVEQGRTNDLGLAPLGLGGLTRGVSPLELTVAYGVLANAGIKTQPMSILRVTDAQGRVLEERSPLRQVVLSEQTAFLMTDMLRGVIERGTGQNARIGRPAAGKTGTHQNYWDAWFVGYTPELVATVWFGEDLPERMVYQGVRYGSWNAATLWGTFMKEALKNTPITSFPRPEGIVDVEIDIKTGLLVSPSCNIPREDIRIELFLKGTEPRQVSPRCAQ